MTAVEVLTTCRQAGIRLEAAGDRREGKRLDGRYDCWGYLSNMAMRTWNYDNTVWLYNPDCYVQLLQAVVESPNSASALYAFQPATGDGPSHSRPAGVWEGPSWRQHSPPPPTLCAASGVNIWTACCSLARQ